MPWKDRTKWKKWFKGYLKEYMREYSKRPDVRTKKKIRLQTQRIYGKVPKGYERHHIDYDSPYHFILIPIKEHKKLHNKMNKKKRKTSTKKIKTRRKPIIRISQSYKKRK